MTDITVTIKGIEFVCVETEVKSNILFVSLQTLKKKID